MEELRDVVSYFVRLSGRAGVNRTVLTKLVYFAEIESWTARGEPLTATAFYRYKFGARKHTLTVLASRHTLPPLRATLTPKPQGGF